MTLLASKRRQVKRSAIHGRAKLILERGIIVQRWLLAVASADDKVFGQKIPPSGLSAERIASLRSKGTLAPKQDQDQPVTLVKNNKIKPET